MTHTSKAIAAATEYANLLDQWANGAWSGYEAREMREKADNIRECCRIVSSQKDSDSVSLEFALGVVADIAEKRL